MTEKEKNMKPKMLTVGEVITDLFGFSWEITSIGRSGFTAKDALQQRAVAKISRFCWDWQNKNCWDARSIKLIRAARRHYEKSDND